jgi:outer membrane lipoprotein-sorting protein
MTNDARPTSRILGSPALRWAVPVAAVVAIGGGLALTSGSADAAAKLPPKSAAQLLADVAATTPRGLSGTVVETARLGLPDLPGMAGGTSLQSLVTGSHTARVWYGPDTKARVSLVGDLAETDVVRNGDDVWLWSSTSNEATHYTAKEGAAAAAGATPPAVATDPATAAAKALAAVDPSTKVSVDGTGYVADRPVYQLTLQPRDARSLIGSVRVAVDAATSVPLRLQVFARGSADPAFETGFTEVQFQQPDASVFRFTPPKGAKVTEGTAPGAGAAKGARPQGTVPGKVPGKVQGKGTTDAARAGGPDVIGKGWTSVAVVRGVDLSSLTKDATARTVLQSAGTVTGPFGTGRLLKTALVSVLVVGDTAYVGAVDPAVVEAAAASAAAR